MREVERITSDEVVEQVKEQAKPDGLKVQIGQVGGFIVVEYSRPVERLVLSKKHAREFANRIIKETIK